MSLLQIQEPEEFDSQKNEEIIIGIDLGTTNSLAAIINNDKEVHFFKENDQDLIASIVKIDDITISSIKRLMGKNYDDIKDQNFPFSVKKDKNNNIKIEINKNLYSPEEISSKILINLNLR